MKIYAFIGPSGTGKSHRAQLVAKQRGIQYIIDDGLFVKENKVVAGSSAKKARTKIESVKQALFSKEEQKKEMKNAIEQYNPQSILILGTSDGMVEKIAENLNFPQISERIYIDEVATKEEMEKARNIRISQGKHVIPVPTFEIKKDFSGFLLDPLQIFKWKGKDTVPYMDEKSIIRPTFSYLGKYTISDGVFREIAEYIALKTETIHKVLKTRVETKNDGIYIYMEVVVVYGYNIMEVINDFKKKVEHDIDRLTAMNLSKIEVLARNIYVKQD